MCCARLLRKSGPPSPGQASPAPMSSALSGDVMAEKPWLSISDARRMLLDLYDISEGRAKKLVKDAIKSGEVQKRPLDNPGLDDPVLLLKDDGMVGFDMAPGESLEWSNTDVHKTDLLYWAKDQG